MRVCCCLVATFITCALAAVPANAQSCNFSISTLDFGNINLAANTTFTSTASFSVNCTGTASSTIRVCPNIDAGSGGTTSGDPRFLLNGGDQLNFNLFQDGSYTSVWGSSLWGFSGSFPSPTIDVALNGSGSGSASRTIYGKISAGQRTLFAGTYTSSFAGAQTTMAYDYSTVGTCATIGGSHGTSAAFTVSANNVTTCSVSATMVNFGSSGVLQAALPATGTIGVTCTNSAPYTISLDGGNAAASDPALRKMTRLSEEITYGLYQNAGYTQPWGDSLGVNTMSNVGTGLTQNFTVYGRVPAQQTPSPGTYTDTVVVTLNY
jgi:spore coat protein U-like protein